MTFRIGKLLLTLMLFAVSIFGLASSNSPSTENSNSQDLGFASTQIQKPRPSPTPTATPCPTVSIKALSEQATSGEPITITASVSGNAETDITYSWSVNGGRIVSGDGTSSIQVVPGPNVQTLTIILEIQADSCTASASITIAVTNLPPSDFGKLTGVVRDPQNRKLNGATVTVFLDNNSTAQEITKDGGKYKFDQLVVGDHDVEASHPRFGPDRQTIRIIKDRTTRKNFKLK